jgi:hypothetical protein
MIPLAKDTVSSFQIGFNSSKKTGSRPPGQFNAMFEAQDWMPLEALAERLEPSG